MACLILQQTRAPWERCHSTYQPGSSFLLSKIFLPSSGSYFYLAPLSPTAIFSCSLFSQPEAQPPRILHPLARGDTRFLPPASYLHFGSKHEAHPKRVLLCLHYCGQLPEAQNMAIWDYFLIRGASKTKFCPHYTHIQAVINIPKVLSTTKAFMSARNWATKRLQLAVHGTTVGFKARTACRIVSELPKGIRVLPSLPTPVGFFVTNRFYFYTCESLCHWTEQSEQSFPLRKHVVDLID